MRFSIIATIVVAVFAQSTFKFQIHSPHCLACVACEQTCIELIPVHHRFCLCRCSRSPFPETSGGS
ncbi:hypothetical protein FA13DRAFT_1507588 [Coprinellus micaceus]|uniref:4Fe-4S ferredoxin-type domain-containing protein n=1 Tax=Coprinellus micaceus TaxID=71717 RepID=A0A4Y7SLK4_COPMI|nr:hypothetical protein FA13DRAFT_1507588 [Coprinellus micaceus]